MQNKSLKYDISPIYQNVFDDFCWLIVIAPWHIPHFFNALIFPIHLYSVNQNFLHQNKS